MDSQATSSSEGTGLVGRLPGADGAGPVGVTGRLLPDFPEPMPR